MDICRAGRSLPGPAPPSESVARFARTPAKSAKSLQSGQLSPPADTEPRDGRSPAPLRGLSNGGDQRPTPGFPPERKVAGSIPAGRISRKPCSCRSSVRWVSRRRVVSGAVRASGPDGDVKERTLRTEIVNHWTAGARARFGARPLSGRRSSSTPGQLNVAAIRRSSALTSTRYKLPTGYVQIVKASRPCPSCASPRW
jgi:hypothetical protein